jgi:cysteine desulfurase
MVYLDHAATSPLLPEARAAMEPWWGVPANPSSVHAAGRRAAAAVDRARDEIGAVVGRDPAGIVFCSGATEANHAAIRGVAARLGRPGRAFASPIEHPSVAAALRDAGFAVELLPVDAGGVVQVPDRLEADLVCVMAVNNEIGVAQPLARLAHAARAGGAWLHVDATQGLGKLDLEGVEADSLAFTAHKLGGPVGTGALSLRDGAPFPAFVTGGSQERGRRGGTVNVAGIVGFAAACAATRGSERRERWGALARELRGGLEALGARIVGRDPVPAITSAVFPGLRGDTLVQAVDLRGVAISSGAACASGSVKPSAVLLAIGEAHPASAIRASFGPGTTAEDVAALLSALEDALPAVRAAATFEAELGG